MNFRNVIELSEQLKNERADDVLDQFGISNFTVDISVMLIEEYVISPQFKGYLPLLIKALHERNLSINTRYWLALHYLLIEYSDSKLKVATNYNKKLLGNSFPEEGVWFIQEINNEFFCFWHPDTGFKIKMSPSLKAFGLGNHSQKYNAKHVNFSY